MASFFSNNLDHFTTSLSYGPKGGAEFISPLSAECMLQYKKKAAAYMKSLKKVCSASVLAQRDCGSIDSWLCQGEYKLRVYSVWNGRGSLNDRFWLRKLNTQSNNATENLREYSCPHNWKGMCQFCHYPFPLIISVPRLQGEEGGCLFKFPPVFTRTIEQMKPYSYTWSIPWKT